MSEKRNYERSPIELAASFGIPDGPVTATTRNISVGGLCIISDKKLRVGEVIEMEIDLNDNEVINLNASVCWCESDGGGFYKVGVKVEKSKNPNYDKFLEIYDEQQGD